jgi:hypothetical protein
MTKLSIKVVGFSLAIFLSFTFSICVLFGLTIQGSDMHKFLEVLLPGFTWISFRSFLYGLSLSFIYGLYTALIFVPVYNLLNKFCCSQKDF